MTVRRSRASTPSRISSSAALGEFHEYPEAWLRSMFVIVAWGWLFVPVVLWMGAANSNSVVFMALISFLGAAVFAWRWFFRHPGLRIGQLGFENRTGVFRVQAVKWQDVRILYPSKRVWWWRAMNVGLMRPPDRPGYPTVVTIRLTGLSATPEEIEAELATNVIEHRRQQRAMARAGADDSKVLVGTRVVTGPDESEPRVDISSARLFDLLLAMEPGRSSLVMSAPALGNDHCIRAFLAEDAAWQVEYQDGAPGRQYAAECDEVEVLHDVFVDWAEGLPVWRTALPWEPPLPAG